MANVLDENGEEECPGCGLPQRLWTVNGGKGFISEKGELHCCRDCAEGRPCSCNPERKAVATGLY